MSACEPVAMLYYLAEVSMRLEHIGDQVLDLIQDLSPHLGDYPASVRQCSLNCIVRSPYCNCPENERPHKAQNRDRRNVVSLVSLHEAYMITYSQLRVVWATQEGQSP